MIFLILRGGDQRGAAPIAHGIGRDAVYKPIPMFERAASDGSMGISAM